MTTWVPDLLGAGFEQTTLELGTESDGPVVATLVRHVPESTSSSARTPASAGTADGAGRTAVLHVHGFNDYFFQRHVAERLAAEGYAFYALDLRRCGRSLRPGQSAHYVADLRDLVPDLTAAARLIRVEAGHPRLVVLAHSTGGLVAALWAHSLRSAGVIDALVLNSPWFDLNARWFHRVVSTRVLDAVSPLDPMRVVASGHSAYSHHLHVSNGGRWDYDLSLKSPEGSPVRAGWLRAIRRGQARLALGLDVRAPVLVTASGASGPNRPDNPDLDAQDTVLDVRQIVDRAPLLGKDVTVVQIPGGVHDLSLSAEGPREEWFRVVLDWLAALSLQEVPRSVDLRRGAP